MQKLLITKFLGHPGQEGDLQPNPKEKDLH